MNRIRELREDRDLRQTDVSAATGIDQRTLSNYETGKTNPDSYAIIKLADFFDVSTDYLLGRYDEHSRTVLRIRNQISKIQEEMNLILNEINKL